MVPNTQQVLSKYWLNDWKKVSHISWLAGCCSQLTGFLGLIPLPLKASLTLAPVIFLKYNCILSYPSLKKKKKKNPLMVYKL